jgi:hypothetical protein
LVRIEEHQHDAAAGIDRLHRGRPRHADGASAVLATARADGRVCGPPPERDVLRRVGEPDRRDERTGRGLDALEAAIGGVGDPDPAVRRRDAAGRASDADGVRDRPCSRIDLRDALRPRRTSDSSRSCDRVPLPAISLPRVYSSST